MSSRDISAFIGHVVMAMCFVADFIDGMTLNDFLYQNWGDEGS